MEEQSNFRQQSFNFNLRKKSIGIVIAVMIMLIASAMGLLLVSLLTTSSDGSVYYLKSTQALFIAESGAQYAAAKLVANSTYRFNVTAYNPLTGNIGGGNFSVNVTNPSSDIFSILSTGAKAEATRVISQTVNVTSGGLPAAFDYALALLDSPSALEIKGAATVSGGVFFGGSNLLTIQKPGNVDNVYATNVSGKTSSPMPNPLPNYPTLDTSWYDNYITIGQCMATTDWTSGTYNLAGGTVYYKNVTINGDISGPGTIVATGTVTVSGTVNIPSNVTIISNGATSISGSVTGGTTVFAKGAVSMGGSGSIVGNVLTPTSFATGTGHSSITGLVYTNSI